MMRPRLGGGGWLRLKALLKVCEDIEQILTFVPQTHEHVLPALRKAIAEAKRKPNGALR